jgi:Zn-dependent protease
MTDETAAAVPAASSGRIPDVVPARVAASRKRFGWAAVGLIALKVAKSFKILKLILAAASFAAYGALYGWAFGVALVIGLSIHESGHVWAMRRLGIPTRGFYLIPFVGGMAVADSGFKTRWNAVYTAAMGPMFGIASLPIVFAAVDALFGTAPAMNAVSAIALMNLFNLMPIRPLDGGRMISAAIFSINRRAGLAFFALAIAFALALAIYFHMSLMILIVGIGAVELGAEFRRKVPETSMTRGQAFAGILWWIGLVVLYFALIIALSWIKGGGLAAQILTHL